MSGYASFVEATQVMDTEQLFDCVELALIRNENERRQYATLKQKSDSMSRRSRR